MRLNPETIAAHRNRHAREPRYPAHTLAPDPQQAELPLVPSPRARRFADACRWCGSIHTSSAERAQCQLDNT